MGPFPLIARTFGRPVRFSIVVGWQMPCLTILSEESMLAAKPLYLNSCAVFRKDCADSGFCTSEH
jgi:hypothetical protein